MVRSVRNEKGMAISIVSPAFHCRLTVTYVPGFASTRCAAPLILTVYPLCTHAGTRSLTSSGPLPFTVSVLLPSNGYFVAWVIVKFFSGQLSGDAMYRLTYSAEPSAARK